jgi:RimJ/RimL family protein N-acetyltransferase
MAASEVRASHIGFRALRRDDLGLMYEWVRREHVRRWWDQHQSYEDVARHYLPAIEGRRPVDLYLILLDGRPVGFIQSYLLADHPDFAGLVGLGAGVAGVDLFIGEEELTGQGLGSEVLRAFVREVVFAEPGTIACIADPDVENTASIRAFEKAGFRRAGEFFDPGDGQLHALVRLDRQA